MTELDLDNKAGEQKPATKWTPKIKLKIKLTKHRLSFNRYQALNCNWIKINKHYNKSKVRSNYFNNNSSKLTQKTKIKMEITL